MNFRYMVRQAKHVVTATAPLTNSAYAFLTAVVRTLGVEFAERCDHGIEILSGVQFRRLRRAGLLFLLDRSTLRFGVGPRPRGVLGRLRFWRALLLATQHMQLHVARGKAFAAHGARAD